MDATSIGSSRNPRETSYQKLWEMGTRYTNSFRLNTSRGGKKDDFQCLQQGYCLCSFMDIFMDWGSKGFLSCEGMMIDSLFVGIPI